MHFFNKITFSVHYRLAARSQEVIDHAAVKSFRVGIQRRTNIFKVGPNFPENFVPPGSDFPENLVLGRKFPADRNFRDSSHHTNQARIYHESDTKSPRGLYFYSAQFHLNGCSSFDSTKEKFEVLSCSRDGLSLTAFKGGGRLEHEKDATDFAVRYVVAKC